MKRILVTGNAGSGKSTLARQISATLGIPCHGLDRVVWRSGWKKTPKNEKERLLLKLIEKDCWVIDGVSATVLAAADTVVFLDVPRKVSFWRVAKRNWKYLFHSRPGLPPNCPEILIIPALLKIIWNFPAKIRPGILEQMRQAADNQRHFHVRAQTDLAKLLAAIENERLNSLA